MITPVDRLIVTQHAQELEAKYPHLRGRATRAAGLVLAGKVQPPANQFNADTYGTLGLVQSERGPHTYTVTLLNDHLNCTCADFQFEYAPFVAGRRLCKHIFAVLLLDKLRQAQAQEAQPADPIQAIIDEPESRLIITQAHERARRRDLYALTHLPADQRPTVTHPQGF